MRELFRYEENYFFIEKMKDYNSLSFTYSGPSIKVKNKGVFYNDVSFETDEETFVKHYGDLLCGVTRVYNTVLVVSDEEKVSLKIFSGNKSRLPGNVYFMGRKDMSFVTFSKKTGDFYCGKLRNYGKKSKSSKSLHKNLFWSNFIGDLSNFWKGKKLSQRDNENILQDAISIFSDELFGENWKLKNVSFQHALVRQFLESKKIKYPDNYIVFYTSFFNVVPLKEIKKNGYNLVDAFMKRQGLSGGVIKKVLHTINSVNIAILRLAYFIFGSDWVNQDETMIKKCFEFDKGLVTWSTPNFDDINTFDDLNMSKTEKRRVLSIFKEVLDYHINLSSFVDHVQFYNRLKQLGETETKWNAKDKKTFQEEHCDYTERIEYHTKGTYKRIYAPIMYDILEKPIKVEDIIFYPKLLNSSESYFEESYIQSNCVKTYVGVSSSYILSVRKKEPESTERASIEFRVSKIKDKVCFTVPQSLGRFNSQLDESWAPILSEVKKRFQKCIEHEDFETVKLTKEFKTGKKLESDSYFDEHGNHRWRSVDITNYY